MMSDEDLHTMSTDIALMKQALSSHEMICVERYKGIHDTLNTIKDSMESNREGYEKSFNRLNMGVVAVLLSVLGFLLQQSLFK